MKPPKNPASTVGRSGSGEKPSNEDEAASRRPRVSHQPQGSSTMAAPTMRSSAMSNGSSVRPAEARPMTMKPVQIATVTTAAAMPTARGEESMRAIIGRPPPRGGGAGSAAPAPAGQAPPPRQRRMPTPPSSSAISISDHCDSVGTAVTAPAAATVSVMVATLERSPAALANE